MSGQGKSQRRNTALRSSMNSFGGRNKDASSAGAFAPLSKSVDVRPGTGLTSHHVGGGVRNSQGSISFGGSGGASPERGHGRVLSARSGSEAPRPSLVSRAAAAAAADLRRSTTDVRSSQGQSLGYGSVRGSMSRPLPGKVPRVASVGEQWAHRRASMIAAEREAAAASPGSPLRSPSSFAEPIRTRARLSSPLRDSSPVLKRRAKAPDGPPPLHPAAFNPSASTNSPRVVPQSPPRPRPKSRSRGPPRLSTEIRARETIATRRRREELLKKSEKKETEGMSEVSRRKAEEKYKVDAAEAGVGLETGRVEVLALKGADALRQREETCRNAEDLHYQELLTRDPLADGRVRVLKGSQQILKSAMRDGMVGEAFYSYQVDWKQKVADKTERAKQALETAQEQDEMAECTFRPQINPPGAADRAFGRPLSAPRQREEKQPHHLSQTVASALKSRPASAARSRPGSEAPPGPPQLEALEARVAAEPPRWHDPGVNPVRDPEAHYASPAPAPGAGGRNLSSAMAEASTPRRVGHAGSAVDASLFDVSGLEARLQEVISRTPIVDRRLISSIGVASEDSDARDSAAQLGKFFRPLSVGPVLAGSEGAGAFGAEGPLIGSPQRSPGRASIAAATMSRAGGLGVEMLSPRLQRVLDGSRDRDAGSQAWDEEGGAESVHVIARKVVSNERHVQRLALARQQAQERQEALKRHDGSGWRPGVTNAQAPKVTQKEAGQARRAMQRELAALKQPVSAHTPFAKSLRASQRVEAAF